MTQFVLFVISWLIKLALNGFCELNVNVMGSSHPKLTNDSYWVVLLHEGGRKDIVMFQNDIKLQMIVSWYFAGNESTMPIDIF